MTTSDPEKHIQTLGELAFPGEWLSSLAENDPEGRTNREVQEEACAPVSPGYFHLTPASFSVAE